jgi:hypothetical protein
MVGDDPASLDVDRQRRHGAPSASQEVNMSDVLSVLVVMVLMVAVGAALVAFYRWLRSGREPVTFAERAERAERAKAERLAIIEAKVRADGERRSAERRASAAAGQADRQVGAAKVASGAKRVKAPISAVGDRSSGVLACPRCGGTGFKAKRSAKAKIGAVVLTPLTLAKASQVKCVTCGTIYQRG